jgi:hypothetical protein
MVLLAASVPCSSSWPQGPETLGRSRGASDARPPLALRPRGIAHGRPAIVLRRRRGASCGASRLAARPRWRTVLALPTPTCRETCGETHRDLRPVRRARPSLHRGPPCWRRPTRRLGGRRRKPLRATRDSLLGKVGPMKRIDTPGVMRLDSDEAEDLRSPGIGCCWHDSRPPARTRRCRSHRVTPPPRTVTARIRSDTLQDDVALFATSVAFRSWTGLRSPGSPRRSWGGQPDRPADSVVVAGEIQTLRS